MQLHWYFDFVSPFAYLHWQKLQRLTQAPQIVAVPIVLGALLAAQQIRPPVDIPGKRRFVYRQVQWRAEQAGLPLRFPPAHPFNSLAALRLCLAAGNSNAAIEAIFNWIWRDGHAGDSGAALAPVAASLGIDAIDSAINTDTIKQQLRGNTDAAIAAGIFGVPTLTIDGEPFWGDDAHGLIEQVLADPDWLRREPQARLDALPDGRAHAS